MSDDKHEQALNLTEEALEKLDEGNEKAAEVLLEKAKALDPSAPQEIVSDMEEDARTRDEP